MFRHLVVVMCCYFLMMVVSSTLASYTYDDYICHITSVTNNFSAPKKVLYYRKLYAILGLLIVKYRHDKEKSSLYSSLQFYLKQQLFFSGNSFLSESSSFSDHTIDGMNIPHVDLAKVREVWLYFHNAERLANGLSPFLYLPILEVSATKRAHHLAYLGKTTHARNDDDGYYDYNSIKQWFLDQGIIFANKEQSGQSLFTENIGRGYYSCKKIDCTDDFIAAITTSWNFFMSEKKKSYRPHYNAIVGNYQYIGLGVVLTGGKYYLVTHYTQPLK